METGTAYPQPRSKADSSERAEPAVRLVSELTEPVHECLGQGDERRHRSSRTCPPGQAPADLKPPTGENLLFWVVKICGVRKAEPDAAEIVIPRSCIGAPHSDAFQWSCLLYTSPSPRDRG
eukprot:2170392-Rhodomonas_salina.2